MVVEAGGVYYRDVISITQIAPNKAILVMPDASVVVPVFSPIQVIGNMEFPEPFQGGGGSVKNNDTAADEKKQPAKPAKKKKKR